MILGHAWCSHTILRAHAHLHRSTATTMHPHLPCSLLSVRMWCLIAECPNPHAQFEVRLKEAKTNTDDVHFIYSHLPGFMTLCERRFHDFIVWKHGFDA